MYGGRQAVAWQEILDESNEQFLEHTKDSNVLGRWFLYYSMTSRRAPTSTHAKGKARTCPWSAGEDPIL